MRRREFIAGLGYVAAWPVVARAQQAKMPVIGWLSGVSDGQSGLSAEGAARFLQGLTETGYIEGQNVAVEYLWAENQADRLPALAADLVRRRVDVIVAASTTAALALKAATTTYPSSLPPGVTRLHWALSPASTGPAGTSPAAPV